MYTPAEEVGLGGQRLASRVQRALDRIPAAEMAEVIRGIRREATARHLAYQRDGVTETVRLLPCPITLRPDQLGYTHYISVTLLNCLKRLPDLYFEVPRVREILRVTPVEEEWLRECRTPDHRAANPVFGRLDAVVDYATTRWQDSIKLLEPNLSGIGGIHMAPSAMGVLADVVIPALLKQDPSIRLQFTDDIRELLLQEMLEHLQTIGPRASQVVLVDPKYAVDGPDEPDALAAYYRDQYGMSVLHADPSELRLKGDDVWYGDVRVDLVYRDASVLDLMDLAEEGVDIAPMRALLRQNRVISSITAELDQKSCFEVFTDPELAERFLTIEERHVVHRHVLWTRIVSDRRTVSPAGAQVDLLEYVRKEREALVLKPNRSYGGEGVVVGRDAAQGAWEKGIDAALADQDRWVVQQSGPVPVKTFHVLDDSDRLHVEPFYVVIGFVPSRYGVGLVARASQQAVVNVAQQGGMCAVLVGAKALDAAKT